LNRRSCLQTAESTPAIPETILEPPSTSFPVLPGIVTQVGLERAGGNYPLYRKLLFMFQANHAKDMQKIRGALEAGRPQEAIERVHSLKGAAGTVGAETLFRIAGALEIALQQGSTEGETLLAKGENALKEIIASIASLQRQDNLARQREDERNIHSVKPLLIELKHLLEQHDTEALALIVIIQEQVHSWTIRDQLEEIRSLLEEYNFEGACLCLNRLPGVEV
jgi:two-component system sensor histidine kinase/response regulator